MPRVRVPRLVPETIQTSAMDCGPASLRSLLAGFGIPVSYGALREACRTDVDGTSIDALEVAARGLGLDCAQLMLPVDHVLPGNLPALLVVLLPSGMPHFVIGWRSRGRYVEVMDPAAGRLLLRARTLEAMLYVHEQVVPASAFAAYATGPSFRAGLERRMRALGLADPRALIAGAGDDWRAVATLDAVVRTTTAEAPGRRDADRRVAALLAAPDELTPDAWFARPLEEPGPDGSEQVRLRGAVLLRTHGPAADPPDRATLPPDLRAALEAPVARPARRLLDAARERADPRWWLVLGLVVTSGLLAVVQPAVLRGALDGGDPRGAVAAGVGIAALYAAVEVGSAARLLSLGRHLEAGLRGQLAARLPLLPDRYLRSRPSSDLAGRAHQLHHLRTLPLLIGQAGTTLVELLVLSGALILLRPDAAPWVLATAALVVLAAALAQAPLREREQRHAEHAAALAQLELDAVLAVHPIRSLRGSAALTTEHTERLGRWRSAALSAGRTRTCAALAQGVLGAVLVSTLVLVALPDLDDPADQLLFALWAVGLPLAGERLALLAQQWPGLRTLALRLAEPLDAPLEPGAAVLPRTAPAAGPPPHVRLDGVGVLAGGCPVLRDVDLAIAAGEHVAVVGASGSGKSTLMAVVLGLLQPTEGQVLVDGIRLDRAAAQRLWPRTAWVDPQVRIWNDTLAANVADDPQVVEHAVHAAELDPVAARIGDQVLGDDGGLLSGGEAQRVRFARALAQDGVRLVVLDEAMRGLDRAQRSRLLTTARAHWRDATLLCATHDLRDAAGFDRVVVMDSGRVAESGCPDVLAADPRSRFANLLAAEDALRADLDGGPGWRRLSVGDGTVHGDLDGGNDSPAAEVPNAAADASPSRTGPAEESPWRTPALLLAAYALAQLARLGAFLGSWVLLGRAVSDGAPAASDLLPWALLLAFSALPASAGTWLEGRFATETAQVLRRRLLRGALGVDPERVRRDGAGRLLGRIMEIEPVAGLAASGGLQALVAAAEILGALVVLCAVPLGRPLAVVLAVVLLASAALARAHVRRLTAETDLRLHLTGRLLEDLAGQRTRRVQGPPRDDDRAGAYRRAGTAADRSTAALSVGPPQVWQLAALAVLALTVSASNEAGDVAAVLGAVLLAGGALRRAGIAALGSGTAAVAFAELRPLLQAVAVVPPTVRPEAGAALTTTGLSVRRGDTTILSGVSLTLRPGDRVLLSGASGSGKSTLVEAMAGLRPTAGGALAGRATLAPQFRDDHVLLAPLAFNLLLGRSWPGADGDLQSAWELCGELGLHPLLERMPAGLAQVVGETGWQLSNGERALLGLARALLARPEVLVVDESLGPMDPETARRALRVVRARVPTLVVVTQE